MKTLSNIFNLISVIQEELQGADKGGEGKWNEGNDTNNGKISRGDMSNNSDMNSDRLLQGFQDRNTSNFSTSNKNSDINNISNITLSNSTDHPITFKNRIEFPIEIYDTITREKLLILRAGENAPLVSPKSLSRSWIKSHDKYPILFDIKVLGRLQEQRHPLLQLPLNIIKPRPYYLQPKIPSFGASGNTGSDRKGSEPIVEETYENERLGMLLYYF